MTSSLARIDIALAKDSMLIPNRFRQVPRSTVKEGSERVSKLAELLPHFQLFYQPPN